MRRLNLTAAVVAVGLLVAGISQAAVSNVYWRVDLHQGSYIIAHGQGAIEQAAWDDCFRLKSITRAMTAAETRRNAVAAITASTVRWCQNPKRYATVAPDPTVPAGTATLSWTPPTQNTDGSALTNLAGYRIHYGTSPTALVQTVQIASAGASGYVISDLSPGTWYFAVRAYSSAGSESANTNDGSKVVL